MPDEKTLGRDERCLLAIVNLYLSSARAGTEKATRDGYFASLQLLEDFVKAELRERSVARAVADTDIDHMREAADILRTMTATADKNSPHYAAQPDIERLSAWYRRDMQKWTRI